MSEENVEVMRRLMRATAAGDYEASVRYLAPDIEIEDTDIPESTGTDSFREWMARWGEIWESWRIEGLELRSSGDDKVLALFRMIAKGKGSGIELTREDAVLGELRGGKIVKVGYYNDQQ
jgi:ketosteroid isomerase-like protein